MQPVYIVDALRTPVGKAPRGVFKHTRPDDLLAHVLSGLMAKYPHVDLAHVEDVIIGCAMPEAEQGMNVARMSLLLAGFPDSVPGMTINRFCSSGLQTIAMAADRIACGRADCIIAGGTESMSMVPMGGNRFVANPAYFANAEEHVALAYGMGITAEKVAEKWQISREAQEAFALRSHERAIAATEAGYFAAEILPIALHDHYPDLTTGTLQTDNRVIQHDEGPRADTTLASMAKLRTVFAANGTVTAATSSQMSDGAAAVLVCSEAFLKQHNLTPLAEFKSFSVAGVPPEIMGIGPAKAIPNALQQAGISLADIDWIELNEAFAAQALAVIQECELDTDKVNPYGGAIALGHPLGATGAIRTATILHAMQRQQLKYGMVTMCIGTGMGAAGIFAAC